MKRRVLRQSRSEQLWVPQELQREEGRSTKLANTRNQKQLRANLFRATQNLREPNRHESAVRFPRFAQERSPLPLAHKSPSRPLDQQNAVSPRRSSNASRVSRSRCVSMTDQRDERHAGSTIFMDQREGGTGYIFFRSSFRRRMEPLDQRSLSAPRLPRSSTSFGEASSSVSSRPKAMVSSGE